MQTIHPTAVIDPKAELGDDVHVGPYTVVEGDVVIGARTEIGSNCRIAAGTTLGEDNRIFHGAVLGTEPQDVGYKGERTTLEIGDRNVIREYCDFNRGTTASEKTVIGSDCLMMAYVHVAHDCRIGDHVICANSVQMGGHVVLEDWVGVGGIVPIHQFCRVGQHAFIGGGFRVTKDVPPFILAASEPLAFKGLNIVGLKRRGFSKEAIAALRKSYRLVYQSKINTSQATDRIRHEVDLLPEVQILLKFIEESDRGIIRGR